MAKRFEKKETDKREIKKEEKKVGVGKAIVGAITAVASIAVFVITKGKSGGTKA